MDEGDPGRHTALTRGFVAAICGADSPARIREDLDGLLVEHGVAAEDREVIAMSVDRLLTYRRMVHHRMIDVIAEFLPRSCEILGPARLRAEFERFMDERAPRSVHFREVPGEFLAWAGPRWRDDPSYPEFLTELAEFEWLDAELSSGVEGGEVADGGPLTLERGVQFDGSVRLRRYAFAVQRLDDPPRRVATSILGYRDRVSHTARLLELTPRAAATCERLLAGEVLQAALLGGCAAVGEEVDDEVLGAMASLLADLHERGVLLGAG